MPPVRDALTLKCPPVVAASSPFTTRLEAMSLTASLLALTFSPHCADTASSIPFRSASGRITSLTSFTASPTSQASLASPKTVGRLNCNSCPNLFESRDISPKTMWVSVFSDSGISGLSSCTCRIVLIDPNGFFKLCEMLAAICPSTAIRSRSANSLSSCNFSSISRHRSNAPGSCSQRNSRAADVSPEIPAPCGSTCSTLRIFPSCTIVNSRGLNGIAARFSVASSAVKPFRLRAVSAPSGARRALRNASCSTILRSINARKREASPCLASWRISAASRCATSSSFCAVSFRAFPSARCSGSIKITNRNKRIPAVASGGTTAARDSLMRRTNARYISARNVAGTA